MNLTNVEFLYFLPVVLLLHWAGPRRTTWQNSMLLAASIVFYLSWTPALLSLLIASTAIDYFVGLSLDCPDDSEPAATPTRRLLLAASLTVNLGALAYFKYAGFFATELNGLLSTIGLGLQLPVLHLLLPLGISFYTLQKVGYIADVYLGRARACRSPLQFALFAGYFPQLTAGPISRATQLLPQLAAPRTLDAGSAASGVSTMLLGFALKAYAADLLGQWIVAPVFGHPSDYGTAAHWLALFAYPLQIFGDFAGYTLLAIGTSRLFGIELPPNFNFPFLSRSLPEFWRRWHITLNLWLFEFIYRPLTTGNGWFRGRLDAGMILVFLASGLWHGASATFITWGALHGIGMVVQRNWDELYRSWCRKDRSLAAIRQRAPYQFAAWLLTQLFFVVTLIPFHQPTLGSTMEFLRGLAGSAGHAGLGISTLTLKASLAVATAMVIGYHLTALRGLQPVTRWFFRLESPIRGLIYGLMVAYLILFTPVGSGTFIYRNF